jgi:predicted nucleic acid-binding protein
VLIVDSSVWIEDLRSPAGSFRAFQQVKRRQADALAVTEPVIMEVLAGARQYDLVRARLNALPVRGVDPLRDYETAAALYRSSRRQGRTVRSLNDCLIAAIALRLGDTVVHRDEDFTVLSDVADLPVIDLR